MCSFLRFLAFHNILFHVCEVSKLRVYLMHLMWWYLHTLCIHTFQNVSSKNNAVKRSSFFTLFRYMACLMFQCPVLKIILYLICTYSRHCGNFGQICLLIKLFFFCKFFLLQRRYCVKMNIPEARRLATVVSWN